MVIGSTQIQTRVMTLAFATLALVSLISLMLLPPFSNLATGTTSMISIHLLMELAAIIIASLIVTVSWHTFDAREFRSANILICGFLIVAFSDTMHVLSYTGMPTFLSESGTPKAIFFWLMGRTFALISMALLALEWEPPRSRKFWLGMGLVISATLTWFGSYHLEYFPLTFMPGTGVTAFKASYEYLLCFCSIIVAIVFWTKAERSGQPQYYLLALSTFIMGICEIAFTSYVMPSDFQNIFGHTYKLVAYALLYWSTFVSSIRTPYEYVRQSEQRLSESEARFRTMFNEAPLGIALINSLTAQFYSVNPMFAKIAGRSIKEMEAIDWKSITHPDDIQKGLDQMALMNTGKIPGFQMEKRYLKKDDSIVWINMTIAPIYVEDKTQPRHLCMIEDITARKNAEENTHALREQLTQASKMEAVGHLTAGIAHDFNNLLGAIMGYTELSKHVITAGKPETVGRYLEEIATVSQRAKELVAQMLAFSRFSHGSSSEDIPVTLLTPVIKEVVALLRSSIPSTIDLNYHVEDTAMKARIQAVNLHQIILNLSLNARDAMGEYGKLNITLTKQLYTPHICDSCLKSFSGEYAKLTVSDTGSGIDKHTLKSIFNPFFTTKEVGKGTGMGLAVVHGLVHALGGHILVESIVTKGTTISALLPLALEPIREIEYTTILENSSGTLTGTHIMVVDDERYMTVMLHEALSVHGAKVTSFNFPLEAWSEFEKNPESFDLVITDETMPDLSGMHLAERILKLRPDLPIILCTGYSEHATPALAEEAGLAGFFYKPLKIHELIQKIHKMVQ